MEASMDCPSYSQLGVLQATHNPHSQGLPLTTTTQLPLAKAMCLAPHSTRHTPHTAHHIPHTTHHTQHTTHHKPHTTHHAPRTAYVLPPATTYHLPSTCPPPFTHHRNPPPPPASCPRRLAPSLATSAASSSSSRARCCGTSQRRTPPPPVSAICMVADSQKGRLLPTAPHSASNQPVVGRSMCCKQMTPGNAQRGCVRCSITLRYPLLRG